jgi:hypothetical protein
MAVDTAPSSIKDILRLNRSKIQEKKKNEEYDDKEHEKKSVEFVPFSSKESEHQQGIRTDNILMKDADSLTNAEMDLIQKRIHMQQQQYEHYERKERQAKTLKVKGLYNVLSEEEIAISLEEYENDEDAVILKFSEDDNFMEYLHELRKKIALKYMTNSKEDSVIHSLSLSDTEEQRSAYDKLMKKRQKTLKRTTSAAAKQRYAGRLRLDDALRQLQNSTGNLEKAMEHWSVARIRAYRLIDVNPNAYYYRFNAPGECQRNGPWTKEERVLFFERLRDVGANGQWGVFSMTIPGRVGYQCSNFYRHLVARGEINDSNYYIDEKGKTHYLFSTKKGCVSQEEHHTRMRSQAPDSTWDTQSPASDESRWNKGLFIKRFKRKKRYGDDDDNAFGNDMEEEDDDYSGTFHCSAWNTTKRTRGRYTCPGISTEIHGNSIENIKTKTQLENPLVGFIDPITLEEVVKPTISPFGHVMGYDTWLRCLLTDAPKNTCPFTKKPLNKRDLVVLNHDNIQEYRSKIVNWNS